MERGRTRTDAIEEVHLYRVGTVTFALRNISTCYETSRGVVAPIAGSSSSSSSASSAIARDYSLPTCSPCMSRYPTRVHRRIISVRDLKLVTGEMILVIVTLYVYNLRYTHMPTFPIPSTSLTTYYCSCIPLPFLHAHPFTRRH